jgi:hypothetical protein
MGLDAAIKDYETLKLTDAASMVFSVNDMHGDYARFEQICKYAKKRGKGKNVVMVLSDLYEHKGRELVFKQMGLPDLEAQMKQMQQLQGMDQDSDLAKALMGKIQENVGQAQMIDHAIDLVQAKGYATIMNKYAKDITFVYNPGNHDSAQEIKLLQTLVKGLKVGNEIKGTMQVGSLKFQTAGNVYGMANPSDNYAYPGEDKLYPHMMSNTLTDKLNAEELAAITEKQAKESLDYVRMTNNGEEDVDLDALLLHSELGKPLGWENKESRLGFYDDLGVAYLAKTKLKGPIVAGHMHSSQHGKNMLGIKTARYQVTLLDKTSGKLKASVLDYNKFQYAYDPNEIQQVLKMMEQVEKQQQGPQLPQEELPLAA